MTTTIAHKNQERQLRRALNKHGYSLHHSRKPISIDNMGKYMIADAINKSVVAGSRYNLSLDDVARWLQEMCSE